MPGQMAVCPYNKSASLQDRASTRQREIKGCAFAGYGFNPESPFMPFDHLFTDCQPDAGSGVDIAVMQAAKHIKNPVKMFSRNPDAVILHGKYPFPFVMLRADVNAGLPVY